MVKQIEVHRTYCKTCQDFTIHHWANNPDIPIEFDEKGVSIDNNNLKCITCNTWETDYKLSDVSLDKLQKQRERYKAKIRTGRLNIFSAYNIYFDLFKEPEIGYKVIEADAGQKRIDDAKRKRLEQYRQEQKDLSDLYEKSYKHLNRNDNCACGSGLKYKKCCITKFNK
jgi:hypothetical protein